MNWEGTFKVIFSALASVGGAGVIVLALSSWLGKVWASRLIESVRKEYQKEIESHRSQLEIFRTTTLRYSGEQFSLYNKLWHSLCELKSAAESLWAEAAESNLRSFSTQLRITSDELEKSYVFIEDSHYKDLSRLLNAFKNYEIGKKKLVEIYMIRNFGRRVTRYDIQELVDANRGRKQKYEQLAKKIGDDLKKQLRGRKN